MKLLIIIVCILCLFFLIIDIIDINRFVIREYEIESNKIENEYKIVVAADLHNKHFGKDNEKLIAAIDDIHPDFICCPGDMIVAKEGKTSKGELSFMEKISKYPVYYSLGNHEYRWKIYEDDFGSLYNDYVATIKSYNINMLENDGIKYNEELYIQGLMIDKKYYKRLEKVDMPFDYILSETGHVDDGSFQILLAHNPEYFENYVGYGADLILSGHVHGGLMRLPVLGGVISPRLSLFPKYSGGIYTKNGSTMLVSCGLGCHTLPIRIFNPGELSVIHLKPCLK